MYLSGCFKRLGKGVLAAGIGMVTLSLALESVAGQQERISAAASRPNILLIVADDLGFSDLGAFGSEISTPNLDKLASSGMRMSNMHVNAVCTQTRSMLLTGVDNHLAGIGTMAGDATPIQIGKPGYEMYLNWRVVTFVRLLQDAGYRTYMAGKWDQGGAQDPSLWPVQRGFDRSFALIQGSADHFEKLGAMTEVPVPTYVEDDKEVDLPNDFYSSKTYASKLIEFMAEDRNADSPFFAFLSFTAPHYPVQAPEKFIDRYKGRYDSGYEPIQAQRIRRQKALGILANGIEAAPAHDVWPSWDELPAEVKALESRRMEVYAASVEAMDFHAGRVLDYLKSEGIIDNTLVIFLSDNGPDGGNPLDWGWSDFVEETRDLSLANMGKKRSYVWMGPGWAHVSATPYKMFKQFMWEGGIVSPTIISAPGIIPAGTLDHTFATVLDIPLTLLEFAGVSHPGSSYAGRTIYSPSGRSMAAWLTGESDTLHSAEDVTGFEVYNRRAVIKGDWKIVYANSPWSKGNEWELYNIKADPTERNDLAEHMPARLESMKEEWKDYVRRNGVIVDPDFPLLNTNTTNHYDWRPPERYRR